MPTQARRTIFADRNSDLLPPSFPLTLIIKQAVDAQRANTLLDTALAAAPS